MFAESTSEMAEELNCQPELGSPTVSAPEANHTAGPKRGKRRAKRSMPVTTRGLGDATDMYLVEIGASEPVSYTHLTLPTTPYV